MCRAVPAPVSPSSFSSCSHSCLFDPFESKSGNLNRTNRSHVQCDRPTRPVPSSLTISLYVCGSEPRAVVRAFKESLSGIFKPCLGRQAKPSHVSSEWTAVYYVTRNLLRFRANSGGVGGTFWRWLAAYPTAATALDYLHAETQLVSRQAGGAADGR